MKKEKVHNFYISMLRKFGYSVGALGTCAFAGWVCNARVKEALSAVTDATCTSQALFGDMITRNYLFTSRETGSGSMFISGMTGMLQCLDIGTKVRTGTVTLSQDAKREAAEIMYRCYGGTDMEKVDVGTDNMQARVLTDVRSFVSFAVSCMCTVLCAVYCLTQASGVPKCVMYTFIPAQGTTSGIICEGGVALIVFDDDNDRPAWWSFVSQQRAGDVPKADSLYGVPRMRALPYFTTANEFVAKQILASLREDMDRLWKLDEVKEKGSVDPRFSVIMVCIEVKQRVCGVSGTKSTTL